MTAPMTKPTLTGPRITLRAARPTDASARFALGNVPEIQAMFGADPKQVRPLTEEASEAWVQSQISEPFAWVMDYADKLIGAIRLHSMNPVERRANIALGILDPEALGQGLGTEAMQLLAAHAFDKLDLHRLTCRVLSFNDRALAAYRKVGFVQEGRERESALIGDRWHDDVIMGLLDRELARLP